MTVLFIARTSRKNPAWISLYCRIKIKQVAANDFSTYIRLKPPEWDSEGQQVIVSEVAMQTPHDKLNPAVLAKVLQNLRLLTIKNEIESLAMRLQLDGQPFSAQQLANRYCERDDRPQDAVMAEKKGPTFSETILSYEKELQRDYDGATLDSYQTRLKNVRAWAKAQKLANLPARKIEFSHGIEFVNWMLDKKLGRSYIGRNIHVLRGIGSMMVRLKCQPVNPFMEVKIKRQEKRDTSHLTVPEIQFLETNDWCASLQQVVDLFLFSCYTGLHYKDAQTIRPSEIRNGIDGRLWLIKPRGKYEDSAFFQIEAVQKVPLSPMALLLIEKYGGGHKLPKISNKHYNGTLKQIAYIAGITINLTVKIGRKTFTDVMLNELSITTESVQAMLGQTDKKSITYYGRPDERRVAKEVTDQVLSRGLKVEDLKIPESTRQ